METVLGLLGMALWIAAVIAFAAAVTYVVVRLFPGSDSGSKPKTDASST